MGTNKNSCKTANVMSLLGKGPAVGRVQTVPLATAEDAPLPDSGKTPDILAAEIRTIKSQTGRMVLNASIEVGRRLTEAKAKLPHGSWGEYLKNEVDYSPSQAQNLMRVFREYGSDQQSLFGGEAKSQTFGHLTFSQALSLLVIPDEGERERFVTENDVEHMSVRKLNEALKERDEALRSAELARAEQSAAQQASAKMAEDMALANERIAGLSAEVDARTAEGVKWQKEIARLEIELSELKNRPVEVAVQVDEKAVEAARKEAEAAMQAQLNKVRKEREKAYDACKAAEDAKAAAQMELSRAQEEVQAVRAQMALAEKKAALASNEDLVLFRALFDQVQELVNKMSGIMMKLRNKAPDLAEKVSRALLALSDKIREAAQ